MSIRSTDNPLVSVMIPVYNGESTLENAIRSLIAQTYSNWKCIIVNDGSADRTKEILDSISDDRFIIYHFKKNKGRPYARQKALELSKGKYLAFLDADDIYHPRKLELQIQFLEDHTDIDLISCGMGSYDSNYILKRVRGLGNEETRNFKYKGFFDAPHAPSMIRLKQAQMIQYDLSMTFAQDSNFFIRYLNGRKYSCLDKVLYYYSEFRSVSKEKILKTYKFGIRNNWNHFSITSFASIKSLTLMVAKYLFVSAFIPVLGTDYFIKKRGQLPTEDEVREFELLLQKLTSRDY